MTITKNPLFISGVVILGLGLLGGGGLYAKRQYDNSVVISGENTQDSRTDSQSKINQNYQKALDQNASNKNPNGGGKRSKRRSNKSRVYKKGSQKK